MRPTVLLLAAAVTLSLVLPYCIARPGESYVKQQSSQQASASTAAETESSESIVKKGGCGCGGGGSYSASKKQKSKAVAASSSSSSSSYEAKKVDSCKKELSEAEIKEKYCQKKGESLETYFKRIVAKNNAWTSTNEDWLHTLSIVWKDFSTLPLWYDRSYFKIIQPFYKSYYAKKDSEDWDSYYSRFCTRQKWESDELFGKRITLLRDCYPTLDLWFSPKWYKKYSKSLYGKEYMKYETESEDKYVERIFKKDTYCDTSDEIWAQRLYLVQEATISSCSLWYNKKYKPYLENFYKVYFKKQEKESCEQLLLKMCTLLPNESHENAVKRIQFIKEATSDCGCWKTEYFKKIQQAKSFEESWAKLLQKTFFPCGCGGGVTIEKKSSKKASAAASSSSQSSSESSKVVSG